MHSNTVLLNEMLEEIVNEQVPVTLFLMNGFQIRGVVSRFDDVCLLRSWQMANSSYSSNTQFQQLHLSGPYAV